MARLTHLQRLEAESIHIMREAVAESERPVMLYSIGKDSSVMLHLALKAFYPAQPPVSPAPRRHDVEVPGHVRVPGQPGRPDSAWSSSSTRTPTAWPQGINPFTHGSAVHTDMWKTEGLKQALDKYGFDVAFGGARRDEEKSRAKERVFSVRSAQHRWDPKQQRPELWQPLQRPHGTRARASGSSRCRTGPSSTSGSTSTSRRSRSSRCTSPPAARWSSGTAP